MIFKDNHQGFTLAEVLITLGIIGVIAAITIPGLISSYQEKRTITQLRAAQSIIARGFKLAEEEYGGVAGWGDISGENGSTVIAKNLKPFLKIAIDCGKNDSSGKCFKNIAYKHLNGGIDNNYATKGNYYKLVLLNGVSIAFRGAWGGEKDSLLIAVDTNGKAAPNTFGRDTFLFAYTNSNLYAVGAPDCRKYLWFKDCPYKNSCQNLTSTGAGCAYYVLNFGNMNYLRNKKK